MRLTPGKKREFAVRQVRDGLLGGACAVLPLLVVNVLGYVGLLDSRVALLAGALALFGGPLLGGAVAGLLGGRVRRAPIPLVAGMLAGVVYLVALLTLVVVASKTGAEPLILAEHPLRVGGAMVSLATLLAMITLGVGALTRRGVTSLQRPLAKHASARGEATRSAARPLRPSSGRSTGREPAARPVASKMRRAPGSASDARVRARPDSSALPSDRRR